MPKTKKTKPEDELFDEELEEQALNDDEDNGDDEEVEAAIRDTINKAEGDFLERNGVGGAKEQQPKAKKKNKVVIGENEVKNAVEILKKYKAEKSNCDERVIDNEEWWKLRHWNKIRKDITKTIEPTSAWLFNSMMNKLADYSDNFPEPNVRARTKDDVPEADRIKNMLPMILEANDYEKTYMETSLAKIKNGTSVTGVFWNSNKDDIDIQPIDILSIYWQPGVKDIQTSRNVFTVELVDNDLLEEQYPDVEFKTGDTLTTAKYLYEDNIDTTDKSAVVDWYYKKKGVLHYCKFVNNTVLLSTENNADEFPNGLYDDGNYPFIIDTLFKMEGTIAGFGYLDVCRSPQEYIDRLDQAIITNALLCAVPRYFKDKSSAINDDEFLDWNKTLIECGNISEEHLRQIVVNQLGSEIFNARDGKIQELKQTSGNSDVSTGTTAQGVTAASAISQLIETGSKGSRLTIKGTYRAYREMIYMIIERMRQFYDEPRYVRIVGEDGSEEFDVYDNRGLQEQSYKGFNGETVYRLPQFDIEVSAQKSSPYNKMNQNELALQFYQYQFFNPENADATLAALDMMDFDHKEDVISKVSENGTIFEALMQAQQQNAILMDENEKLKVMADLAYGSNLTGNNNGEVQAEQPLSSSGAVKGALPDEEDTERALGKRSNSLNSGLGDNSKAEQLRRRAADATEV